MHLIRSINSGDEHNLTTNIKYKPHLIKELVDGSIAQEMGIEENDILLAINNQAIEDVFDYRYLMGNDLLEVLIEKQDGERWILGIEKYQDDDLGLVFESDLMDEQISCQNKCKFCFIDQLPPHMRDTVYFKDDDWRLSFLHGNYITLTNMSEAEIERLIFYKLSPMNISIHVTDPQARKDLLSNRFAGDIIGQLKRLTDAGIKINGQIVLCKGINDGELLEKTISDLSQFIPHILSLTIVPVGLSQYREGLAKLDAIEKEDARQVIETVHKWQEYYLEKMGTRFVFAADEFYVTGDYPLPPYQAYEDFPVLENGVGMLVRFQHELESALKEMEHTSMKRTISIATGAMAEKFMRVQVEKLKEKAPHIDFLIYPIKNCFFGEFVSVTGLLTGVDIIGQLQGQNLGDTLLLSNTMLKDNELILLDDMTTMDISEALDIPVTIVENNGAEFIKSILHTKELHNE